MTTVTKDAPVEAKEITFTKAQMKWLWYDAPHDLYSGVVRAYEAARNRPRPRAKTPYDRKPIDYLAKQEAKYIARLEQIRSAKEAK